MTTGTTSFKMRLVIGLNSIAFRALFTNPLLVIAVLSPEVLLDTYQITKRMARVMVQATRLRAYKNALPYNGGLSFEKFPRNFMSPSVHLQVLVSLKPLVTDLAHVTIRFQ